MVESLVFLLGFVICVGGALGVVLSKNAVHAAVSLVGTLFGIAILFIAQDAEFLAAVQVIVYAGAVVVMFLFVIMLLGVDREEDFEVDSLPGQRVAALIGGALLLAGLASIVLLGQITGKPEANTAIVPDLPNVEQLARSLFTDYLWAFEITSILLIIGVVGALSLARHRRDAFVDDLPGDTIPSTDEAAQ